MKFNTTKFLIGFSGGSFLTFMAVNSNIMWGSLVIGLLFGLMNEGYMKKDLQFTRKENQNAD